MTKKNGTGMENGGQTRRNFMRKGLFATSILAFAPRGLRGQPDDCTPTSTDRYGQGPFYSSGAPSRYIIASPEETGVRLFLTGTVFADDCITPLRDVVVDVWHADHSGCYSRFENCENPSGDDFKLRGVIRTGTEGTFAVETIMPGRYLNGAQYRPSHIHFKVRPPKGDELITQLYFEGDPYIPTDLGAADPAAAGRIIPLEQRVDGLHGIFDIVLDVDPSSSAGTYGNAGETRLRQNYPNPVSASTRIPFHLAKRSHVRLTIHDTRGRLISTLLSQTMDAGAHAVAWDVTDESGLRLPAGSYVYRLRAEGCDMSRIMTVV